MNNIVEEVWTSPTKKKVPRLDGFTAEFHQAIKEELTPKLFKLFKKLEKEETKFIL
jgi:hypothetical protein